VKGRWRMAPAPLPGIAGTPPVSRVEISKSIRLVFPDFSLDVFVAFALVALQALD
jgi:hypothetical protein